MSDPISHRMDYEQGTLDPESLLASPTELLDGWLKNAEARAVREPHAMTLATCTSDGTPSARIVLLRGLSARGLTFYTNYESRKGAELTQNPRATLLFFWPALEQQVRVEGAVSRLSEAESREYFHSRPRESQLGAWASQQSAPLDSRATLEQRLSEVTARFAEKPVDLPPFWGGYLLEPTRFEFWQGRKSRLHDRVVYTRSEVDAEYTQARLYP